MKIRTMGQLRDVRSRLRGWVPRQPSEEALAREIKELRGIIADLIDALLEEPESSD